MSTAIMPKLQNVELYWAAQLFIIHTYIDILENNILEVDILEVDFLEVGIVT
jgi:hypothetical protein